MATKSTFDLFGTLRSLDSGDLTVYEASCNTDAEHKDFDREVGWMLPQWMSSATNPKQQSQLIVNVNKVAVLWGALNSHPQLRTQLLATCGLGRTTKHRFPRAKKSASYGSLHKLLLQVYPDVNPEEVELWCKNNNIKDVEELARTYGLQDKELDPLLKAFKKINEIK